MKKYANLKNKTFLDFTDDAELIAMVLRSVSVEFFLDAVTMMGRLSTFIKFAELTNNKELKAEAEKQFEFLFNE